MENQFTICPGCGAQITNLYKCEFCGMSFGNDEPDTDSHYSTPKPKEVLKPVKPKVGFIFGLISLFVAGIPFFGFFIPMIGIGISNNELKKGKNSLSSAGKTMSIIGIIISIITMIISIILHAG